MAASGSTDYAWRVGRTAFLNMLGYTQISSQKEVEKVRKRILAVNKDDWAVLKMNIYQNKLGKSKDIPKETTVTLPPERTQPQKLCTANFSSGTLKTLINRLLRLKNKNF